MNKLNQLKGLTPAQFKFIRSTSVINEKLTDNDISEIARQIKNQPVEDSRNDRALIVLEDSFSQDF